MGTNYYLHTNVCPHCGRSEEVLHIGKSSIGWCFGLHVRRGEYEAEIPVSLSEWQDLWNIPDNVIRDEYGTMVTPDQMMRVITDRHGGANYPNSRYRTKADFCRDNNCLDGPNGLVRHRVDGFCVAHGEGTWDCLAGEFS